MNRRKNVKDSLHDNFWFQYKNIKIINTGKVIIDQHTQIQIKEETIIIKKNKHARF